MTNPTSVCCTRVFTCKPCNLSSSPSSIARRIIVLALICSALGAISASASVVQYYATTSGNADGTISDSGFSTTGAHCSAPGCDSTLSTRYTTLTSPTGKYVTITPQNLTVGSNYTVEICVPTSAGNIGTNMSVTWTFANADDGNGGTPVFDATAYSCVHYGASNTNKVGRNDLWYLAGQFRATDPNPTITATWASTTDATSSRWNEGAYRINLLGDCRAAVPQLSSIDGPLIVGQTSVTVLGVTNGATAVYAYANGTAIGTNNSFNLGTNLTGKVTVVTPSLNKGDVIQASQIFNPGAPCGAVEGYLPSGGPLVGGGANPVIRMCFEVGQNSNLIGPIGANAGGSGSPVFWMGSSGRQQPTTGSSFLDGVTLTPGAGWQTVTFNNNNDVTFDYNDAKVGPITGTFAVLSGVAFAMEDTTDTGPFQIFVDNVKNGSTVLFDAETDSLGSTPFFNTASGSGSFGGVDTAENVLPDPNLAAVVNTNSDTGTKSALVSFQFAHNEYNTTWLHLSTKDNPEIDLSQPISMRVLVLPVGTTTNALNIYSPAKLPDSTNLIGSTITYSMASAILGGTDSGSVNYQWQLNGANLSDSTTGSGTVVNGSQTATLRFDNATTDVQGTITCVVTATSSGASSSVSGNLTVAQSVPPSGLTYSWTAPSSLTLSWSAGVLQSASALQSAGTVWTDVPSASSPYQAPLGSQRYYRVRGQ